MVERCGANVFHFSFSKILAAIKDATSKLFGILGIHVAQVVPVMDKQFPQNVPRRFYLKPEHMRHAEYPKSEPDPDFLLTHG